MANTNTHFGTEGANGPKLPPGNRVWDLKQACSFLGLSRNTIYKLIKNGELPAFKLGNTRGWRFDAQDLEKWIQRQKQAA